MANAAFKIGDNTYEFPQRFRMGDAVLIEEITGLTFAEFSDRFDAVNERLAAKDDSAPDALVMTGMIAAGIWQANPTWKRDRVVRYVEQLDFAAFATIGGEPEIPPAQAESTSRSPDSSNESTTTPELSPDKDPS